MIGDIIVNIVMFFCILVVNIMVLVVILLIIFLDCIV